MCIMNLIRIGKGLLTCGLHRYSLNFFYALIRSIQYLLNEGGGGGGGGGRNLVSKCDFQNINISVMHHIVYIELLEGVGILFH